MAIAASVLLLGFGEKIRGDFLTADTSAGTTPTRIVAKISPVPQKPQWNVREQGFLARRLELGSGALVVLVISLLIVIIRHRKTAQSLRNTRENFRTLAENINEGIVVSYGRKIDIVFANSKSAEILGYKVDEFLKLPVSKIFHPDEIERIYQYRNSRYESSDSAPTFYQTRLLHKDEHTIPVETSIAFTAWQGKKAIITSFRDITDRKLAEETLRKERDFAESLVDTAQVIVLVLDPEGKIVRFNPYMEDISGYSLDEVRGKDWFTTFLPEEDQPKIRVLFAKAIGDARTKGNVNAIITRDGSKREIEWYDKTLRDANGIVTGLLSVGLDITERKQAAQAIYKSETHLRTLVETLPDLVWLKDEQGIYLSCNLRFENFFGVKRADIIGKTDYDFVDKELADSFHKYDKAAMAAGKPSVNEEEITFADDGHHEILETIKTPMYASDGGLIGVLGIGRSITKRRQAERQLTNQAKFVSENPNPVMRITRSGDILHTNKAARVLLENMGELQNRNLPEGWNELVDESLASGKLQHTECECGKSVFSLTFVSIVDSGYVNVYAHDITKRKNTERKLLEHQKKLRSLARQLAKAEERQRRRIASGLHDNVVQNLAAVKISAAMLHGSTKSEKFRNEIEGMIRVLDDTIYETRTLTFELCPPILHNLGFAPAAEWLVEEFGKHNKITTEFKSLMGVSPCDMPEDIRDLMFQLLREILTNVAKHAEASNVKVIASSCNGKYIASVEDNGRGFDVLSVMSRSEGMEGFGLFNIRERLGHFEGYLDIDSKQGKGTKVTISLPNQNDGDTTC